MNKDHTQESTHWSCRERIKKYGSKAICCACSRHECLPEKDLMDMVKELHNKEAILDAAKCASFMQKFKMMMWERKGDYSERVLDEIAMEIYDYFRKV